MKDQSHDPNYPSPLDPTGLDSTPPGPVLAQALSELRLADLCAHELVVVVRAWERQKAWDAARQFGAMDRLVQDPVYDRCDQPDELATASGHTHRAVDPCGDELSLALSWSPGRAKTVLITAIELIHDLPATLEALSAGRLDADKARLIAERTRCLTIGSQREQVERAALREAYRLARTQLDHLLRRAVIAADPQGAEDRRAEATDSRRVCSPQPASMGGEDGMAVLTVYGPAEDLNALYTAVDAAARHLRAKGEARNLDQLRFDALTALGWTALGLGHLGCCNPGCADEADDAGGAGGAGGVHTLARRHGKAASVHVTVAASTLFGADEQPGWLDGFGPVTAQVARRIAADGTWRRLLTDPATGEVLEYGRSTYTPPARLVEHVLARDQTCRSPTCSHPARHGDIDHRHPYAEGGTTGVSNCWALHRQHHVGKTFHRYRTYTDAKGETWWVTPAGHRYPVKSEAVGPVATSPPEPRALEPPPF